MRLVAFRPSMRVVLSAALFVCLALCAASAEARATRQGASSARAEVPRAEVPRPDFVRADWQTLNGRWEFEFDDANRGVAERWYAPDAKRFSKSITEIR